MRKNLRTIFGFFLLCAGLSLCACPAQAKKKAAYLFTYFTGNAPEKEQICYAISHDGFNYTPLNNGQPVIASDTISLKKAVRDPHILRAAKTWSTGRTTPCISPRSMPAPCLPT